MRRVALGVLVVLGAGCGADRAPAAPGLDAAGSGEAGRDASPPSDGGLGRRDGAAAFPPVDLEVVLPYGAPPERARIEVSADLGRLDVHFSVDTTGSFGEEIDAMQADLEGRIVPRLRDRVDDVAFGVSRFEDFPAEPWGAPSDLPFELLTPITTDLRRVASAVAALDPLGNGGDVPESGAEAIYQIATGDGYRAGGRTIIASSADSGDGNVGGVGFREGALRVVVHVTDASTHEPEDYGRRFPGTRSTTEAAAALRGIGGRVVGIASSGVARGHLEQLALETGAVSAPVSDECLTGIGGSPRTPVDGVCPLVFSVASDGTGLSETIVDAIVELVNGVAYDEAYGQTDDDGLAFVRAIEAVGAEPPEGVPAPTRADRRPAGDGLDDTFLGARTGTRLVFEAVLANRTLPPADYDQVFHLVIEIRGDDLVLARRRVRVIVPRGRLDGGPMLDAGTDAATDAGPTLDAGTDAATDAGPTLDAGTDTGTDAATGGSTDAGLDAALDGG